MIFWSPPTQDSPGQPRSLHRHSQAAATAPHRLRRAASGFLLAAAALGLALALPAGPAAAERPNILWLTSEDNGQELGCYGHPLVQSPNIDRLAERGLRFTHASSNAPVCAPARTTIITGLYAPSVGGGHMRSAVSLPDHIRPYPVVLREAGYYCTNNSKTDYNLRGIGNIWDESSNQAHWRNRPEGKPFFAIFNDTVSHESQMRRRPHQQVIDPADVEVPAYHPDTPEVRQDWAQYFDKINEMDGNLGRILDQLEEDGLADDTIIFYYGDHGSGLPRHKRWLYQGGLEVAMIVVIPEKFQHLAPEDYEPGGVSDRPVAFVDLAPTLLSLIGIEPPEHMEGRAFLGEHIAPAPEFTFGHRERMDERYDLSRSVFDGRFKYIRNYRPDKAQGQFLAYMFQTPTTQVWHRLWQEGELTPEQAAFFEPKPVEELYDTETDPDEVVNLAESDDAAHREALERLRAAHRQWVLDTRDPGLLPESEMLRRAGDDSVVEMKLDPERYDVPSVLRAADLASDLRRDDDETRATLLRLLSSTDSAVRYWGVVGLLLRGEEAVRAVEPQLTSLLEDESPATAIAAAEAIGRFGVGESNRTKALDILVAYSDVEAGNAVIATEALNGIDAAAADDEEVLARLRDLPGEDQRIDGRYRGYPQRLRAMLGVD